jgi:hypothetical protein
MHEKPIEIEWGKTNQIIYMHSYMYAHIHVLIYHMHLCMHHMRQHHASSALLALRLFRDRSQ